MRLQGKWIAKTSDFLRGGGERDFTTKPCSPGYNPTPPTHLPVVEEDIAILLLHLELDLRPVPALQSAQHHQEVAEEDWSEHALVESHLPDDYPGTTTAHVPVQRAVPEPQAGTLRRGTGSHFTHTSSPHGTSKPTNTHSEH